MVRVHYVHWHESERDERAARLEAMDLEVDTFPLNVPGARTRFRKDPPDAVIVDLSRLPSHGREVAAWLTDTRSTQHIPVLFVDGAADKVAVTRQQLPTAVFVTWKTLPAALRRVLRPGSQQGRIPPSDGPRKPNPAGYSGTPLPKKLGIRPGMVVHTIGAPEDLAEILGELPDGVVVRRATRGACDLLLWFPENRSEFERRIGELARRVPKTGLWICWPRQASGVPTDLGQNHIREVALASGLVDFKVCSVNAIWSGLQFAVARR